ncbi:MAG: YlxR family protein [Synergistaceae bacterium]|nr:YlxR family protein [Synergistaceae bacterium]
MSDAVPQAPLTRRKPRTCVACRAEASKQALVRLVRTPGGDAVLDPVGKLPGRGAYLCLNRECLERARKSGALARALKTSISDACWEGLARSIERYGEDYGPEERAREVRSLLGMSRRANLLLLGMDAAQDRAKAKKEPLLLLTARDASSSVTGFAEGLVAASRERKHGHIHLSLPLDVESLSAALGTGGVQLVALPARSGGADKLRVLLSE